MNRIQDRVQQNPTALPGHRDDKANISSTQIVVLKKRTELPDIVQGFANMSVTRQVIHLALGYPARLIVYGVVAFVLGQTLYAVVLQRNWEIIGQENGLVERTQAALALFGAVAFFVAATKSTYGKAGLVLCGSLAGYAAGRECDQWLETHLFNDAYKYLIGLPLLAITLVVGWKHR